jgi:hypothetical protein
LSGFYRCNAAAEVRAAENRAAKTRRLLHLRHKLGPARPALHVSVDFSGKNKESAGKINAF